MILDNLRKAIQETRHINCETKDPVEAFLINRDDWKELCDWAVDHGQQIYDLDTGTVFVYGVKIIESPYVPKGTIYKFLKDSLQEYMMGGFGAGVSGMIPASSDFSTTMPASGSIYVPKPSPPPAVPKKPEKKHSPKRRIELD